MAVSDQNNLGQPNEAILEQKKVVNLYDYAPMADFLSHNKKVILNKVNFDNEEFKALKRIEILTEMKKYFILPLIRDAFYWIFEFIRNLTHFGYREFIYISSFYIYLTIFEPFSFYYRKYTFTCDFFIFFPFIVVQTVGTYNNSGSWEHICAYIVLCYIIVCIPRVFLAAFESIKKSLQKINKSIEAYGSEKYSFGFACAIGIIYGASLAMVFYSEQICMISMLPSGDGITDLYMRECLSGLVVFSLVRSFFLYTEFQILNTSINEDNILCSANKVNDKKNKLFLFMLYSMFIIGSISFIYVYYSIHRAMIDTSIVDDAKCIHYVAKEICKDPLALAIDLVQKGLSYTFEKTKDFITDLFKDITLEDVLMHVSPLYWLFSSMDTIVMFYSKL